MKFSLLQRLTLILLAGLAAPRGIIAQERKDHRPNVIFILADDAGYADFGSYGQLDIETPNLDRMADEGMVFTDHYAGAPVCAPSRSTLMTGQHTGHTPIRGNEEEYPEGQYPLPDDTFTIAEMLQGAGVETAVIGKWGLGYPGSEGAPDNQGFDYFYGYNCQRQAHNYYPDHLWENNREVLLGGKVYTHDLFTDKALSWIEENQDNPFFLYLAYTIPHAALQIPDLEPYDDKPWNSNMKKYAAMVTRMDRDIGVLLDRLESIGIGDNTLVLFSSDNGPHGEGGADPDYFDSNGPYRGMKRDLYEGGIRVPLIARWPGTIRPGERADHISAFWDFLPTVADIYGLEAPENIDGISYLPTLKGEADLQKQHDELYWEFHENGGIQAVRSGKWKAVRKWVRLFPNGPMELYNLEEDPGETENLASDNKDIVEKMNLVMRQNHEVSSKFPFLGKTPFKAGFMNGWLFVIPLALVKLFMLIRCRRRSSVPRFILFGRIFFESAMIATAIATPLMAMSRWFGITVVTALLGICFHGNIIFRRLKDRRSAILLSEFGLGLFWLSLGASVPSRIYLTALIGWMAIKSISPVIVISGRRNRTAGSNDQMSLDSVVD